MGGGAWRGACSPAAPTGRTAPARAGDPPPLGPRAGRGTRLGRCRASTPSPLGSVRLGAAWASTPVVRSVAPTGGRLLAPADSTRCSASLLPARPHLLLVQEPAARPGGPGTSGLTAWDSLAVGPGPGSATTEAKENVRGAQGTAAVASLAYQQTQMILPGTGH